MKQFKYYLMAAFVAAATCTGFSSCSDNDDEGGDIKSSSGS
jgi:sirohydrochlorin cobaltochelatase